MPDPAPSPLPPPSPPPKRSRGQFLFETHCGNCARVIGGTFRSLRPRLRANDRTYMRELRKIKQEIRKLRRARPLKGDVLVRCAADEELLRRREEAEETGKRLKRRRIREATGSAPAGADEGGDADVVARKNETVDITDKGRKEGEQVT